MLKALNVAKADATTVSSVRWYAEVLRRAELRAPVGSPMTTLGPWGDNDVLLGAEAALGDCAPAGALEAKAVSALFKEYRDALPPGLRGYALAQAGRVAEAASLYRETTVAMIANGPCPSEHVMYAHRRVSRMTRMLSCLKRWQPQADEAAVEKALERARTCAANNHSIG